jgi:hypothetical protein
MFAVDANGNTEINFAGKLFQIAAFAVDATAILKLILLENYFKSPHRPRPLFFYRF